MAYQGYGSVSKQAERQRALAQQLMPQNIGAPVAGIGGGLTQLAQALMSRKANKKADKLEEAHRVKMAAALQSATAGMSPDQQAFAQAFPELFAKSQAANMFPDAMKQKQMAQQQSNADRQFGLQTRSADRADRAFDYQMNRDIAGDKIRAEQRQYQQGRDAQNDQFRNNQFAYQQGQDRISNQQRNRQIDATIAKASKTDLGKTPIYLRGQDGKVSIGQLGNGQVVPAKIADGMSIVDPMQKAMMQQQGRSEGKTRGETAANMPAILNNAQRSLKTVEDLINHKGIDAGTGLSSVVPALPGTDKKAFNVANKQLGGQVFLQGFEALKGGGVITEIEGQQAKDALARADKSQSKEDYIAALNDYKDIVSGGMAAAYMKAGMELPENLKPYAMNIQQGGQTFVYNPQTGGFD